MQSSNARHNEALVPVLQEQPRLLYVLHGSIFEGFGGIEYYLDDLIQMSVDVFGQDNVRVVAPLAGEPQVTRPYSVRFAPRPSNPWFRKLFNRVPINLFTLAQEEIESFNPTLMINSHVAYGPTVWALSKRNSVPYLTLVYGIEAWGNLQRQDEFALKRSHGIISISEWTKMMMTKRGYSSDHFEIIYPRLPQHLETLKTPERSYKKNKLNLLTVSRLEATEAYKGHDHVLEALAKLKKSAPHLDLRYTILGNGSDRHRLELLAGELSVDEIVTFRDSVKERDDLIRIYGEADTFIMPSRFGCWDNRWRGEGFGIVYVEAAALGVPTIAYNCGGATDAVTNEQTGLLAEPDNIDSLAAAIQRLAENPEERKKMGECAKVTATARFAGPAFRQALQHAIVRFSPHEPQF